MEKLCTPNTKFKFGRDASAIVYTVVGSYGYGGPDNDSVLTYNNENLFKPGTTNYTGAWGIRNYKTGTDKAQFRNGNIRQRWTIQVTPPIGTQGVGYDPVRGTLPPSLGGPSQYLDDAETIPNPNHEPALKHDAINSDVIYILEPQSDLVGQDDTFTENPAVWEIEPRESVELDIYYQASPKIPIVLDNSTNEELLPIGSTFVLPAQEAIQGVEAIPETTHTITGWDEQTITFTPALTQGYLFIEDQVVRFNKYNNYSLDLRLDIQASRH
jgi:hypothetical protein